MTLQSFLSSQEVSENRFYGIYSKLNEERGYLNELISANECKYLIHPDTGRRMGIGVPTSILELEDGAFYEFSIALAPDHIRAKTGDQYYLNIDKKKGYKKLERNPFQEIIRQRFERLESPEGNLILANLLKEVGKGLYLSKKRLFFELLQNADDVPTTSGEVKVYLETKGDYLVLMHDGLPFDKDDVESITSAAESTKQKRQDKTGFKGIGFKSVFTDSEEVIIKSGGFNFKFDRHDKRFKSFENFYFNGREKYGLFPGLREYDKAKYASSERKFQGSNSLPWQLLPIWADTIPEVLLESGFAKNNNVSIGLKIGAKELVDYIDQIKELFEDGRFLLFLRNTALVKFSSQNVRVQRSRENNVVTIRIFDPNPELSKKFIYSTHEFEVPVDDELIESYEIDLVRREEEHEGEAGEKQYFFSNKDGKKLETIPPKIAAFKSTTLSFAAPVTNGKIDREKEYEKDLFSSIYTYLPMREFRVKFPFLVNADFIPSSSREQLLGDNPWNQLLMGIIGQKVVEWVANLGLQDEPNYLNLLLPKLMEAQDKDVTDLVEYFNKSYLKAIEEIAFIKNEDGELQTQSETVLDLIGLTKVIPITLYHEITGTGKKLPAKEINSFILRKDVFKDITKVSYQEVLTALTDKDKRITFKKWMLSVPAEELTPFLDWVENKLIPSCEKLELNEQLYGVLENLSLFSIDGDLLAKLEELNISVDPIYTEAKYLRASIAYINSLNKYDGIGLLFSTKQLLPYKEVLAKTGFLLTENYSAYNNIIKTLLKPNNLNHDGESLYKKLKASSLDKEYNTVEAVNLFKFVKSIGAGYYEKAVSELAVFSSKVGLKLPIKNIFHQQVPEHHPAFAQFYLKDSDWEAIAGTTLENSAITYDKVIGAVICNEELLKFVRAKVDAASIKKWYEALLKYLNESELENLSRHSIEIVCTSTEDDVLFNIPNKILFNSALKSLTRDEFEAVKDVLEKCSNYSLNLPVYEALDFIEQAGLNCKDESVVSYLKTTIEAPVSSVDALIKYLKISEHKEPLFDQVLLTETEESKIKISASKTAGTYQVRSGKELFDYINSIDEYRNKFFLLPRLLKDNALEDLKLMYERELIDQLLKGSAFDIRFIDFIEDKDETKQHKYLNGLEEIPLSTTDKEDNSYSLRTLNLIHPLLNKEALSASENALLDKVRSIVTLDGKSREKYNMANDIYLNSQSEPGKQYKFELSKLVESSGEELSSGDIKKLFPKWSLADVEKFFKPITVSPKEIREQHILGKPISNYKLAFMMCHADAGDGYAKTFTFKKGVEEGLEQSYAFGLLDELKKQKAYHFLPLLSCFYINEPLEKIITPSLRLAGSIEVPPKWLEDWANKDLSNLEFLYKAGLKGPSSNLLTLRKQFQDNEFSEDVKSIIHSNEVLSEGQRTIEWLTKTFATVLTLEQAKASVQLYEAVFEKKGSLVAPLLQEAYNDKGELVYSFTTSAQYYIPANFGDDIISKIRTVAKTQGISLIPPFYSEKLLKSLFKQAVEILKGELDEKSIEEATPWGNKFYQNWPHKDTYKVYCVNSPFIRVDTVFGVAIMSYSVDETIIEYKNSYYTTLDTDQEIVASLELSNKDHRIELLTGVITYRLKNDDLKSDQLDDPNYAAVYEELVRDFRDLDKDVQMSKNMEALQMGIIHLAECGFEITSDSFIGGNAIHNAKKDGISYKFYCHSAVGGLLFITPGIMQNLYESETGVVVIYPNGQIKHFIGIDELIENPENSYFLLRAKNNKDKEQFRDMIRVSRQYQSHFMFVTSEELRKKLYEKREDRKHNKPIEDHPDFDPSTF